MDFEGDIGASESEIPRSFQVHKQLDFIDISEGGCLLLGSSNLSGNYWDGGIFYFKDPDLAPEKDKWSAGFPCESGVTTGKFLHSEEKVIVGADCGSLTIYNLVNDDNGDLHLIPEIIGIQHDSAINSIDISRNKEYVVSGGDDLCINIWEVESMRSVHHWYPAHSRSVTSVAASPSSPNCFASASRDGIALMWDIRMSKPAIFLTESKGCSFTSLSWPSEEVLLLGDVRGWVTGIDGRRVPGPEPPPSPPPIPSFKALDRSIHYMTTQKKTESGQSKLVGICGDTATFVIWDYVNNTVVLEDCSSHTGMVRGLSWTPEGSLYTCGLDKKIVKTSPPFIGVADG